MSTYEDDPQEPVDPVVHGTVRRFADDLETLGLHLSGTCDWGECDEPVVALRFDAHGHGWLPVCATCATKPEVPS